MGSDHVGPYTEHGEGPSRFVTLNAFAIAAETENRSVRGGSFLCHGSYCNRYRMPARTGMIPNTSSSNIGFRVVRT
jgi:formylglycine-generating enzyme required for sulfatase activity